MRYLIYGGGGFHPDKIVVSSLDNLEDQLNEGEYTIYQLSEIKKIKVEETVKITEVATGGIVVNGVLTSEELYDQIKRMESLGYKF